jgi:hypothetical protein
MTGAQKRTPPVLTSLLLSLICPPLAMADSLTAGWDRIGSGDDSWSHAGLIYQAGEVTGAGWELGLAHDSRSALSAISLAAGRRGRYRDVIAWQVSGSVSRGDPVVARASLSAGGRVIRGTPAAGDNVWLLGADLSYRDYARHPVVTLAPSFEFYPAGHGWWLSGQMALSVTRDAGLSPGASLRIDAPVAASFGSYRLFASAGRGDEHSAEGRGGRLITTDQARVGLAFPLGSSQLELSGQWDRRSGQQSRSGAGLYWRGAL